jgi:hypothetical protein
MNRRTRIAFLTSGFIVSATGIAIGYYRYLATQVDEFSNAASAPELFLRKIHLLSVPVFLLSLGSILDQHALPYFFGRTRVRRKRLSGIFLISASGFLIYTGFSTQLITEEPWRNYFGYLHLFLGLAFTMVTLKHRI